MKKGFVKNLTSVFRRYENRYTSLNKRFIAPDNKSDDFCDKYNRVRERSVPQKLLHAGEFLDITLAKYDNASNSILVFIDRFTNIDISDAELERYKAWAERLANVKFECKDREKLIIKFKDGRIINVQTITSAIDDVADEYPDLETSDRRGKCHPRSLCIALMLDEEKTYCVTGVIWPHSPRAKWLHSWVECEWDGATMCIDNNLNAIMSKENYYYLNHAKVLERISQETLREDIDIINYFGERSTAENPYLKLYCASRDETVEKYYKLLSEEKEMEGV